MSKRFDRIPRTIVRGLSALLALALLLGGDWAMRPMTEQQSFLGVQPAHAAEGCGTGSNTSYTMETYEKGGGQYFFTQDTCKANATATTLRDRANDQDFCATRFGTGATLFSLLSLVFQNIGRLSGLGALEGFAIAGDCGVARGMYTSVANKIQQANQACGTQGISYQMRVRRESLEVFDFQCQPSADERRSLDPEYPTEFAVALIQGPESDGGDECGVSADTPYYTSSQISDEETEYYRAVYLGYTGDGSNEYRQAKWNYETGEYDVDQGTVTRCTPPPAATPAPPPTTTPAPTRRSPEGTWDYVLSYSDTGGTIGTGTIVIGPAGADGTHNATCTYEDRSGRAACSIYTSGDPFNWRSKLGIPSDSYANFGLVTGSIIFGGRYYHFNYVDFSGTTAERGAAPDTYDYNAIITLTRR